MKIWKKAALSAVAVSLLSATPAWAAKPKDHEDRLSNKEAWLKKLEEAQEAKAKALEKGKVKAKAIKKLPAEMKAALQKIIKLLPELKDFEVSRATIREGSEYQPEQWTFTLENGKRGSEEVQAFIELNADTGVLSSYHYEMEAEEGKAPDYDEAKKKADAFLKKIMGTEAKKYKFIEEEDEDKKEEDDELQSRYFAYERLVHDIPLEDSEINIVIDSEGRIVYFRNENPMLIKDSSIPKPKNVLSENEADEKYADLLDMELLYNKKELIEYPAEDDDDDDDYESRVKTKPVLKYEPRYSGAMDAVKGEIPKDLDLWEESKNEGKTFTLSPKGEKLVAPNRAAAEQLLTSAFGIDISKYELDEDVDDDETYYYWEAIDNQDIEEIEMEVDSKTGEILDLYVWHSDEAPEPKLSEEQALEFATAFVERFIDTDIKEVQLRGISLPEEKPKLPSWVDQDIIEEIEEEIEPDHTYRFTFNAMYQGAPVINDRFSVEVNATTGKVEGFGYNQVENVELPDNENVESEKKAAKAYLKAQPLKLKYIYPELFGYKSPKPILVYQSEYARDGYIDAFTGEFVEVKEVKKD